MLTENEQKLLFHLTMDPFASQQTLADAVGLSRPAVANLLSRLTEKGYIVGRQYLLNHGKYVMCIGGANLDRTLQLRAPLKRETSNPVHGSEGYGGVARNVAENLGRLGIQAALMTLVGKDRYGEQLVYTVSSILNVFPTEKLEDYRTGSYVAVLDTKGELEAGFADMDITEAMNRDWILRHSGHLNLCNWILCDCNVQADALEELVQRARLRGGDLVLIGVSSAKIRRIPKDLRGVRLVLTNREESMAYFDTEETDTARLCESWLEQGAEAAVVTAGTQPYAYGDADGVHTVPVRAVPEAEIEDVTGAGDAFSAGVVFGLLEGEPLSGAVRYGAANSRLALTSRSAVRKDLNREVLQKELDNESVSDHQ